MGFFLNGLYFPFKKERRPWKVRTGNLSNASFRQLKFKESEISWRVIMLLFQEQKSMAENGTQVQKLHKRLIASPDPQTRHQKEEKS